VPVAGRLSAGLLLAVGCANEGSYELSWTVGGEPAAQACAPNGLDFIVVDVVRGEEGRCVGDVADHAEYSCDEGTGRQSLIDPGTYNLCAVALSPAGVGLTPLVTAEYPDGYVVEPGVKIRDGEASVVSIDFPAVPQCQNGLDDDGDWWIDLEDPDCLVDSDDDEES